MRLLTISSNCAHPPPPWLAFALPSRYLALPRSFSGKEERTERANNGKGDGACIEMHRTRIVVSNRWSLRYRPYEVIELIENDSLIRLDRKHHRREAEFAEIFAFSRFNAFIEPSRTISTLFHESIQATSSMNLPADKVHARTDPSREQKSRCNSFLDFTRRCVSHYSLLVPVLLISDDFLFLAR